MKIIVDWTLCDGNGNCAEAAPEVFAITEDDTMRLLQDNVGEELSTKVQQAVQCCPKGALKTVED